LAPGVDPEFEPQYCKKRKNTDNNSVIPRLTYIEHLYVPPKKKRNPVTCYNMDELGRHYTK
jgi:hypothetical protein